MSVSQNNPCESAGSRGKVIAELSPPANPHKTAADAARAFLRGSVLRYDRPFDPAFEPQEWDINR
jgi:hypothetical protein